ncbi:MAG: hypothetical protein RL213_2065 [Bacteroidota bacterium]|jgi:hypothetical protein
MAPEKVAPPANFSREFAPRIEPYKALSEAQLNRCPAPGAWSIAQCLQHILLSDESYFPALERLLEKDHRSTFWEKHSPFTRSTGKSMILQLGTETTRRFKSPRLFLPTRQLIPSAIRDRILAHWERLDELCRKLEEAGAEEKVIRSPVAPLITLRVNDAIVLFQVHTRRHLQQADKVLHSSDFREK